MVETPRGYDVGDILFRVVATVLMVATAAFLMTMAGASARMAAWPACEFFAILAAMMALPIPFTATNAGDFQRVARIVGRTMMIASLLAMNGLLGLSLWTWAVTGDGGQAALFAGYASLQPALGWVANYVATGELSVPLGRGRNAPPA